MKTNKTKRYIVLGILFFLPVAFLLMLYPAQHHYEPLNVVNKNVTDLEYFSSEATDSILLKNHITVLGFLGKTPLNNIIEDERLKVIKQMSEDKYQNADLVVLSDFIAPAPPSDLLETIKQLKAQKNRNWTCLILAEALG